jgi:hypothetical protein
MLTALMFVILFGCVAMIFAEGLWGAAIMFFNVVTAAMLATILFEPTANWFNSMFGPSYTYFWDFLAIWAVFALSLVVLRIITDMLSRHKVRFKKPVDIIGGVFFAAWIGWILIQFTLFSLHTAPLARNSFDGGFQAEPDSRMFLGLGPDRNWLAFIHTLSAGGSLSRDEPEAHTFDPQADFILKYAARRAAFEKEPAMRVK